MKVWWVLAGDYYYPSRDNFIDSFETEEEAIDFVNEIKKSYEWLEIKNISNRLQ